MKLRKLTPKESLKAAEICGYNDEHALKKAYSYDSVSRSDIFIDEDTNEIYVADKDGSHEVETGYTFED